MIKGVTRQIIEINNTASPYFEKAVLYVRPEASGHIPVILKHEAHRYLEELHPQKTYPINRKKVFILGALITLIILALVYLMFLY